MFLNIPNPKVKNQKKNVLKKLAVYRNLRIWEMFLHILNPKFQNNQKMF